MSDYTNDNIGCHFDGAFGIEHNSLRVIDLAKQHGFTDYSSRIEKTVYSPNGLSDDDMDAWFFTLDSALDYLNENTTRPDNSFWAFEDGDFGLWQYCEEHFDLPISSDGPCIVCGNKGGE